MRSPRFDAVYGRSIDDPEGFWGEAALALDWEVAPLKPPPITTTRAADCAIEGRGKASAAADAAMPRTTFLRVILRRASISISGKWSGGLSRPPLKAVRRR